MTPEDLDAIEARAKAATPGPWAVEYGKIMTQTRRYLATLAYGTSENEAFVAHARADVPALVAALRQAWKDRDDEDCERLAIASQIHAAEHAAQLRALTVERDAFKLAKSENDERFMTERDAARIERDRYKETLEAIGLRDCIQWDHGESCSSLPNSKACAACFARRSLGAS